MTPHTAPAPSANRRFWVTYSYAGEDEVVIKAPDATTAEEMAWRWLERTYPGDAALDVLDMHDIGPTVDTEQGVE